MTRGEIILKNGLFFFDFLGQNSRTPCTARGKIWPKRGSHPRHNSWAVINPFAGIASIAKVLVSSARTLASMQSAFSPAPIRRIRRHRFRAFSSPPMLASRPVRGRYSFCLPAPPGPAPCARSLCVRSIATDQPIPASRWAAAAERFRSMI